ncbi:MAG: pyridoxal phosphate-dependent aminotransferase [Burkholderiales bacterium]|jgi:aspartate/methionine/tyrosine aminotransferase
MNQPNGSSATVHLAARLAEIEPFHVVTLVTRAFELEAQGRTIINMVIGEPDFPTPQPIVDAGIEALRSGRIRYTPSLGDEALRNRLQQWYRDRYAVDLPTSRVAVTSGSSAALLLTMGALLSPGDEVLMADPSYPCNRYFVRTMEGKAVAIPVDADTGYQLTADLVEKHWTPRTVAVMVATPSNPTGTLIAPDELKRLHAMVQRKGGVLIVDEIYHGLTYGFDAHSVLEFADDVFVINSFSKYFCMTGWRLGWMVVPQAYAAHIEKLAQNLYISNSDIAQQAALAAFGEQTLATLEANRRKFQEQRDYLLPALRELGFDIPVEPQGAFYIYANCSKFTSDSYRFCWDVLEDIGVAIAPGIDFGAHRAAKHVRFSYPKPVPVLEEGVRRLRDYLKT